VAEHDLVLAFPGQGSLSVGVGVPWRSHPSFQVVKDVASASGVGVAELLVSGTADELVSTDNAQLATYALSLCILDATGRATEARWAIGHSLGEYTALVAAGYLDRVDGTRLVAARGRAMQAAALAAPGGLVAAIGGDEGLADKACGAIQGLSVANYNGPGQIVFGGATDVLARLAEQAKDLGFRRVIPLKVGGAFHTDLMAPAVESFGPLLTRASFHNGTAQVVANVDGAVHVDPSDWPLLLTRQLTAPVRFDACVRALPSGSRILECGPGKVLQGLIRRIREDLDVHSVGDPGDLASIEWGT
jgi:[acyl-carrier-protein] S-malonyltransferase